MDFITRAQDLVLYGDVGTGKPTWPPPWSHPPAGKASKPRSSPPLASLLFQIIADGYENRSLIITTNIEFSRWGTVFGDDNMAAAVIDRLVHHGRLLQSPGESYRVKDSLMK